MSSWNEKTLTDLGSVSRGKSRHRPRNADFLYGGKYPFIQTSDVKNANLYITEYSQTYSEDGLKQSKLWHKETLCITIAANIADTGILGIDACFPDSIIGFVAFDNVSDVRFVKYCFDLLQGKIKQISQGAAQDNLSMEKLATIKFNIPDYPTQKRIASILSAYDDLIENNLKRIKLLEEIAQRTYEEWFVKFRVNGEQLPIDENTGLPVGWNYEAFNTIVEIISGFPFKSSNYVEDGKYKIVTIKNVQDGYFVPETTDSLLVIPTKVKAEQVLNTGDIIVSLTGNVGRICLVYGENYLLNQRVAKIIPLDKYAKAYVYFLLRSKAMITSLENLSNGAAQQNLSPINMGNMKMNIPDKKLIMKFGELANSIIDLISKLNLENQKLKQSRDILLPRLMNGTINVES